MKIGDKNILKEDETKSHAFRAAGLFLYEFSQLEYTIRDLLRGVSRSAEEQLKTLMTPNDFLNVCAMAEKSLIERAPRQESAFKELFDKCRNLNADRMIIVQGFCLDSDGNIPPQFVSPSTQKALDYFTNPDKLIWLARTAKEISDKFINDVLVFPNSK